MRNRVTVAATFAALMFATDTCRAGLLTSDHELTLEGWLNQGNLAFTNIYTKADGDSSSDFHAAVDNMGPTIVLLEASGGLLAQDEWHVIGGYNPRSWTSSGGYNETWDDVDRTAFVFNLNTNDLQHQRLTGLSVPDVPGSDRGFLQTFDVDYQGPTFGGGHDLFVDLTLTQGHAYSYSYGALEIAETNLITGVPYSVTEFAVRGLEVYTFAPVAQEVPEPSSLALLATGGLIGAVRLRRRRIV